MKAKSIIQKIIVAGIVLKDEKVLIIQRGRDEESYPDLWELPSGKREPLEASSAAVIREVKEETGLVVEVIRPISVFEFKNEKPDEIRDATQINFLVKYLDGEVKLSTEHQNFAWVSKDDLDKYNLSDTVKKAIKAVYKSQWNCLRVMLKFSILN